MFWVSLREKKKKNKKKWRDGEFNKRLKVRRKPLPFFFFVFFFHSINTAPILGKRYHVEKGV